MSKFIIRNKMPVRKVDEVEFDVLNEQPRSIGSSMPPYLSHDSDS